MLIVIEGLDGSGKTTTARLLAQRLSAIAYRSPPAALQRIQPHIESARDIHAMMFFYLSANFCASAEIEAFVRNGNTVVCDRYYYSTLAGFAEVMQDYGRSFRDTCAEVFKQRMVQPEFAFFLDASAEERARRMHGRGNLTFFDRESLLSTHNARMASEYAHFGLTRVSVDGLSREEVVQSLLHVINDHQ